MNIVQLGSETPFEACTASMTGEDIDDFVKFLNSKGVPVYKGKPPSMYQTELDFDALVAMLKQFDPIYAEGD